eukprot:gnl/Chilomastix_cuspidata/1016.p1 GENE.gnl/Chilomastix_cuspidata/1016~~gnl/Chilomastix_cuspidata/1016.p1  ORF type:complete len:518 (+),score=187.00 gnl/Chilomastix_cuspidata/1016:959-2512(+)
MITSAESPFFGNTYTPPFFGCAVGDASILLLLCKKLRKLIQHFSTCPFSQITQFCFARFRFKSRPQFGEIRDDAVTAVPDGDLARFRRASRKHHIYLPELYSLCCYLSKFAQVRQYKPLVSEAAALLTVLFAHARIVPGPPTPSAEGAPPPCHVCARAPGTAPPSPAGGAPLSLPSFQDAPPTSIGEVLVSFLSPHLLVHISDRDPHVRAAVKFFVRTFCVVSGRPAVVTSVMLRVALAPGAKRELKGLYHFLLLVYSLAAEPAEPAAGVALALRPELKQFIYTLGHVLNQHDQRAEDQSASGSVSTDLQDEDSVHRSSDELAVKALAVLLLLFGERRFSQTVFELNSLLSPICEEPTASSEEEGEAGAQLQSEAIPAHAAQAVQRHIIDIKTQARYLKKKLGSAHAHAPALPPVTVEKGRPDALAPRDSLDASGADMRRAPRTWTPYHRRALASTISVGSNCPRPCRAGLFPRANSTRPRPGGHIRTVLPKIGKGHGLRSCSVPLRDNFSDFFYKK